MAAFDPTFPHLWRPFRYSIFRDEYRTDFAEAEHQINLWAEALKPNDIDGRLGLDLLRAVHSILTGKIHDAERILRSMSNPNSNLSTKWQSRAENYRRLIIEGGAVLHAFDNSISLPDFQSVIYKTLEADRFQRAIHLGQSALETYEEEWTLLDIMAIKFRTTASKVPKISPIHPQSADTLQANQKLLQWFDGILANYAISCCYPYKLRAEIAHVQGLPSDELLNKAFLSYENMAPRGYAACLLLKGDWTVSHPFSNPTSLNLMICESTRCDGSSHWDSLEDSLEVKNSEEASKIYDEAWRKFEDKGGLRGKAAVHLRKACLSSMNIIFGRKTDARLNENLLAQSRRDLDDANQLFEVAGDLLSVRLVSIHKMIFEILTDPASFKPVNASEIGRWGASTGSFQYAHDLGLLLLRTGLFMWRRWQAFDSSTFCLEAAQELFSALGAQGTEAQAEAARAKILAEKLDLVAAQALFLASEAKLRALRTRLSSTQRLGDWEGLTLVQSSLHEAMVQWGIRDN